MNTKFPDDPNEICGLLAATSRDVYNGLIHGSMKVREYFDSLKHQINSPLAANLARYHAKHTIAKNRNLLTPYMLEEVPNNGIALRQDLIEIKVLKGRNGDPPCPSKSKKSEAFYAQSPVQLPLFKNLRKPWATHEWKEFVAATDKLRLLFCWEVDASFSITRLQLMCPRQPWKYMQGVKLFWATDIPHPVTGLVNLPNVNENQEELEDLEIYFDETGEVEN